MHNWSEDLETASLTFALTSLLEGADDAGLFLRDEVVEGLSLRDDSARVEAAGRVWLQCSGDSLHLCEWIRLTSVVSSIVERMGNNCMTLLFTATMRSATARKAG